MTMTKNGTDWSTSLPPSWVYVDADLGLYHADCEPGQKRDRERLEAGYQCGCHSRQNERRHC